MTTQILSIVSDIKGELYKLNSDIAIKLIDVKKDYIENIKTLFSHSELSTQEKINHLLEKSNDSLLSKTTILVNDIIPKTHDKNYQSIENCIKQFFSTIVDDTKQILKMNGSEKSLQIEDNINKNIQKMFSNIQQSLFNAIQSSELRTSSNIQQIQENIILNKQIQESLSVELSTFLNK
jgi:regulator of sigma D